ncbi:MAG: hypothetical protein HY744_13620 [Deltaproteobacteria bacterium]|nr:hypothetical protein [Deltaproteobacteria bacterium]
MTKRILLVLLSSAVLFTCLVGCAAGPLIVTGETTKGNRVKFLYSQVGSDRRGIIECVVEPKGDIQACRHLAVHFEGED